MPTSEIADPSTDRSLFCAEGRSFAQVWASGIACRLGARSRIGVVLFVLLVVSLEFFLTFALAAEYMVTPLARRSSDINDSGRVLFEDEIVIPNASNVTALGINNSGQIVGYYSSPTKMLGFLKTGDSAPVVIDVAGSISTEALGVNNIGQVVGSFETHNIDQQYKGFLRQPDGTMSLVEFPGARTTVAYAINDDGWIVGSYRTLGGTYAFLRDANGYRTLTTPEAGCYATAINDAGKVLGNCPGLFGVDRRAAYAYVKHGVDDAARIDILTFGPLFTEAYGINNKDQIVGLMGNEDHPIQGFLASPSAPPTVTVTSNAMIFHPDELLEIGVTVANPGSAVAVDVYVGAVLPPAAGPGLGCPSGDAVAFISAGAAQVTCLSAPPQTFQPFAANVTLPGGLPSTTLSDFFTYTWGTTEPAGAYTFFLALTPVGALADGQIGPSDVLAAGAQTVTFDPGH